mmetsp:Transcript_25071/g.49050  ORF Transcript_25071/g.49050 Transcript_25071/m.49050 type:complete len:210 (+) Transcript_25071:1-630(+)
MSDSQLNVSSEDASESKGLTEDSELELGCVVNPELLQAIKHGNILPGVLSHLTTSLRDEYGNAVGGDELSDKIVGLYFSAGWCGPCRAFSPVLKKFHEEYMDDFRVVFVSMDRSERDMVEYIKGKGFLQVDYKSKSRTELIAKCSVTSIPSLVIVDGNSGEVITTSGRMAIQANPDSCIQSWKKGTSGVTWCDCIAMCFGCKGKRKNNS